MNNIGMGLIRKNNTRNRILYIIRTKGKVSKMDIKKISRYSMVTVLDTIEGLAEENTIFYAEKAATKSGRRPTYISINPDYGYFLGISFHAGEITLALLNYCGETIDYHKEFLKKSDLSVDFVLNRIYHLTQGMLDDHQELRGKILGIGIGSPGYVDEENGVSLFYPHIDNWKDIPLKQLLEEKFRLPVYVENNSNAMALAYKWLIPDMSDMSYVIISIRSGVRMSCVINSTLYKGKNYTAGEIGHIRVNGGTRYCPCGRRGCLDTEISEPAIRDKILEGIHVNLFPELWEMANREENKVNIDLFIRSIQLGHKDSIALLDEICDYLSDSITQIVNILNPSKVIINAHLCELGDLFFSRLKKNIWERAVFIALEGLTLESIEFGETAAAVGAAAIVMEKELDFVDATI